MSNPMVRVTRGDITESWHHGDIAIVDENGHVKSSLGDAKRVIFARSSAKPLQALPLVESGAADFFNMSPAEIALCCASHNGEEKHTDLVFSFLNRIGVSQEKLRCGTHAPYYGPAHEKLLRDGAVISEIHNNCSGKHAGMLAYASFLGADLDTYLDLEHPVQQRILRTVSEVCEIAEADIEIGIDGCGVPVHGLPLWKFAMAFARFVRPSMFPEPRAVAMKRIASAMMQHPDIVAGTGRFCTDLMSAAPGEILGKAGAEGVYCAAVVSKGIGICVKTDDGNARAAGPATVEALYQSGLISESVVMALASVHRPILKNHQGKVVGSLQPDFKLEGQSQ